MQKLTIIAVLAFTICGCSTLKRVASNGVNVVASIGTNTLSLLDLTTPLVQDPLQPGDPDAVVVNPAFVASAQQAATTFGGPYGLPIAAGIGVIAGIVGVYATQRRKTAQK